MATDSDLDAAVRRVLGELLAEGAPYTGLPLVNPSTSLLPDSIVDAIRAPLEDGITDLDEAVGTLTPAVADLEELTTSGRLSEAQQLATIDGVRFAAFMDLTDKANGALPTPRRTDSGHPYTLTVASNGQPGYVVEDGALVAASGLAYLHTGPLPGPVRDFRIRVKWEDEGKTNSQPAVMIVADDTFQPVSGVASYANSPAHVLVYRNRFVFQKRAANGTSTELLYWAYGTPLAFDEWHDFRFTWDGRQVTVIDSEGVTHLLDYDAQVAEWWGAYATVETVAATTENRVMIRAWSADTTLHLEPEVDPAEGAVPISAGKMVKTPATTTTTLTSPSYTTVETVSIVVPPSKMVSVWAMPNISCAGDGTVYGQIDVGGHPTSVANMALLENQAWAGVLPFFGICDLSAFTVGQSATVNVKLMATGTASFRKQASGPPRRMPVHVTPVEATFA